jgi:hypothetical protein
MTIPSTRHIIFKHAVITPLFLCVVSVFLLNPAFAADNAKNASDSYARHQNTALSPIETVPLASEVCEGLFLNVKLDEAALKTSGRLSLELFCGNTTDKLVKLPIITPDPLQYRVELMDPKGKKLETKPCFPNVNGRLSYVPPGMQWKSIWDLNVLFKIHDPGVYKLHAWRYVPLRDGKGEAKLVSNQLEFELTEADIVSNANSWAERLKTEPRLRFGENFFRQESRDSGN